LRDDDAMVGGRRDRDAPPPVASPSDHPDNQ
jgi:hypothetical protein